MEFNVKSFDSPREEYTIQVLDGIFDHAFNEPLVHQVVVAYLANARKDSKRNKSRADVSGGGIKPWRQKGTGRARAGTIRSPLWRKGGVTFAIRERSFRQKINKKMHKSAMQSVLSDLYQSGRLILVEKIAIEVPKTKILIEMLRMFDLDSVLIVTEDCSENLYFAARNLPDVDICDVDGANAVNLLKYPKILMTVDALRKFEERLA